MRSFMGRSLVIEPSASFISDPDKVFIENEIYPEYTEGVRGHEVRVCFNLLLGLRLAHHTTLLL